MIEKIEMMAELAEEAKEVIENTAENVKEFVDINKTIIINE